jgi:hypothetical protein
MKKLGTGTSTCDPRHMGSLSRKITVQISQAKSARPYMKNN